MVDISDVRDKIDDLREKIEFAIDKMADESDEQVIGELILKTNIVLGELAKFCDSLEQRIGSAPAAKTGKKK